MKVTIVILIVMIQVWRRMITIDDCDDNCNDGDDALFVDAEDEIVVDAVNVDTSDDDIVLYCSAFGNLKSACYSVSYSEALSA